jgi:hypothetical protein
MKAQCNGSLKWMPPASRTLGNALINQLHYTSRFIARVVLCTGVHARLVDGHWSVHISLAGHSPVTDVRASKQATPVQQALQTGTSQR